MGLASDLSADVAAIFRARWTERDGDKIPDTPDIGLGNDAVKLTATILYTDLSGSTALVDSYDPQFAAEVYKAFLHCAARIVRSEGAEITAYDGDRLMAVFIGNVKNTSAARSALKINWAGKQIINPAIRAQYPQSTYQLAHVTGVDTSSALVARTGIRGANDLVWVGRAANHAAKLAGLSADYSSRISAEVYSEIHAGVKTSQDGRPMWEAATWTDSRRNIFRSNWMWCP